MSITEYERHQLFTWFEEHMGKERATTMMNLVPPVGWGDVATARDLALVRRDLDDFREATRRDLEELRNDIETQLATTRHELRDEVAATRRDLHDEIAASRHEIAAMETRLGRTFAGWLFASQATVIGAMAVLLAIN